MTEAEWLTATDPAPMVTFLSPRASDRKFRLAVCACCRLLWETLTDERSRSAVLEAEGSADSLTPERAPPSPHGVAASHVVAEYEIPEGGEYTLANVTGLLAFGAAWEAMLFLSHCSEGISGGRRGWRAEKRARSILIRCIFGNPFRPATANPAWLTSTVVSLAAGIYADRAFDRLPILADALQDAGCDNADVLGHCRGPGPHVRGCWVVDLVLGKQ
jgi:hypothetical protein